MATKTKLTDLFNSITNPGGGFATKTSTAPTLVPPAPVAPSWADKQFALRSLGARNAGLPPPVSTAPVIPIAPAAPIAAAPVAPVAPNPSGAPVGPQGATGGAPASQTPIPSQWMKADGTFKTPDEVAAEIGGSLRTAHSTGDAGRLALAQFGNDGQTTEEASAAARDINNTRNDIAVGETDPYKVASQSGIAYTPAELTAIEKAYAGVYDPALNSAMAKVEAKQAADKAAADNKAQQDQIRLKASLDAEQPYTLGKDQVRYDAQGNPIAVGISSDTSVGTYTPGADPTVDAYVKGFNSGTYKASDIPDQYKGIVAQGVAQTKPTLSKSSSDAVSVIDQLLTRNNLENLSGFRITDPSSLFPGTEVQVDQNLAKQLNGILKIENRAQLKGSGAISDFEFRVLGDASSALGIDDNGRTNLSPEQFKAELEKLQLKLQVGETDLTDDELQYLHTKGYTPDQIRQYSQQQSFSSVGNTTASTGNIPQKNNNPGNVKAGGLADSLATGKDKYGHLIFPDAATGFKALTADVTAKLNGTARIPKNPTIAQLGKVYAEDPNWPKGVARILGVSPDTLAQAVPIDKLVHAIAQQEGFYA